MRTIEAVIKQDETPIATEVLAKSIVEISKVSQKLLNSGLSKRAIVLLIWDQLPVKDRPTKKDILAVIDTLPQLGRIYTTAVKK